MPELPKPPRRRPSPAAPRAPLAAPSAPPPTPLAPAARQLAPLTPPLASSARRRRPLARLPRLIACCALLVSLAAPTAAHAQGIPGRVVSGPDLGTLSSSLPALERSVFQAETEGQEGEGGEGQEGEGEGQTEGPPPASAEPAGVLAPEGDSEEPGPAEPTNEEASPPEPAAETPAPPPEAAVTLDGQGSMLSRPFGLRGGEYAVTWSAQTSNPECTHNATLHAAEDGRPIQSLGGAQVFGGSGSGQTALHDLPGASYYLDAVSTCRWSITISPV